MNHATARCRGALAVSASLRKTRLRRYPKHYFTMHEYLPSLPHSVNGPSIKESALVTICFCRG